MLHFNKYLSYAEGFWQHIGIVCNLVIVINIFIIAQGVFGVCGVG